ncbi:hypothetical protein KIL84_001185, partial [Mauremys mutica]
MGQSGPGPVGSSDWLKGLSVTVVNPFAPQEGWGRHSSPSAVRLVRLSRPGLGRYKLLEPLGTGDPRHGSAERRPLAPEIPGTAARSGAPWHRRSPARQRGAAPLGTGDPRHGSTERRPGTASHKH